MALHELRQVGTRCGFGLREEGRGMSMSAIAAAQELSVARVSQLIGQAEMDFRFKT